MSHFVQEEGQKIVDTPSRADTRLKTIGSLWSHNISDTSSRKECEKDGADKPVHDELDDSIVSHQKSKSHLVQ